MSAEIDLAPDLADPSVSVVLARVERKVDAQVVGGVDQGRVSLAVASVIASGPSDPGERVLVGYARSTTPVRDGGDAWDRVALDAGAHLLVGLRMEGAGWSATALQRAGGGDDPTVASARLAARLARGPVVAGNAELVGALAAEERLPREALLCRLARVDAADAVQLIARAIAAAPRGRRDRLGLALSRRFDPEQWASRGNALVVSALARALLGAERADRLAWARYLAGCLRYPFDPAPERQERVARALVLLVDAPPVEMVAALEGLGGQGTPEDQAAARDVLSLWLQL